MDPYAIEQEKYTTLIGRPNRKAYDDRVAHRALTFLKMLEEGDHVLDVGCRDGVALCTMLDNCSLDVEFTGCEIVPRFVEIAREYTDVIEGDFQTLPLTDRSFDWVFCSHTVEHFNQGRAGVEKLFRIARKGVFIVVPIEDQEGFEINKSHYTYYTDPIDWLTFLRHPDFFLLWAHTSIPQSDLTTLFVRKADT